MNKVEINDHYQFDIDTVNGALLINQEAVQLDVVAIDAHKKHIIFKNKSFNVELIALDTEEKEAKIKVNGNVYTAQVTTQLDLLLKQLGMDNLSANKVLQVKAPMPGLVLSVAVKEGDVVKKGDSLLVLEAMKMENIIKSPADGVVQKIEVAQGDKIEKNTILLKFG